MDLGLVAASSQGAGQQAGAPKRARMDDSGDAFIRHVNILTKLCLSNAQGMQEVRGILIKAIAFNEKDLEIQKHVKAQTSALAQAKVEAGKDKTKLDALGSPMVHVCVIFQGWLWMSVALSTWQAGN